MSRSGFGDRSSEIASDRAWRISASCATTRCDESASSTVTRAKVVRPRARNEYHLKPTHLVLVVALERRRRPRRHEAILQIGLAGVWTDEHIGRCRQDLLRVRVPPDRHDGEEHHQRRAEHRHREHDERVEQRERDGIGRQVVKVRRLSSVSLAVSSSDARRRR